MLRSLRRAGAFSFVTETVEYSGARELAIGIVCMFTSSCWTFGADENERLSKAENVCILIRLKRTNSWSWNVCICSVEHGRRATEYRARVNSGWEYIQNTLRQRARGDSGWENTEMFLMHLNSDPKTWRSCFTDKKERSLSNFSHDRRSRDSQSDKCLSARLPKHVCHP